MTFNRIWASRIRSALAVVALLASVSPAAFAEPRRGQLESAYMDEAPPADWTMKEPVLDKNGNVTGFSYTYQRGGEETKVFSNVDVEPGRSGGAGEDTGFGFTNSEVEGDISICESKASNAKLACDPLSSVAGEDGQFLEQALNQAAGIANQIGNIGKSQHEQCKSAMSLAKTMGIVNVGKGAACKHVANQCESACENAVKQARQAGDSGLASQARRKLAECKDLSQAFQASIMQGLNYAQQYAQSAQCAEMTKAQNAPQVGNVQSINCSDPNYARTSPACVCATNPRDPMCLGMAGKTGPGGMHAAGMGLNGKSSASGGGLYGNGMNGLGAAGEGDLSNIKDGQAGKNAANGIPQNGGGGFGQGGGGNYGPMAGAGSGEEGPAASGLNTNVIQGVSGSGGGGGGFGGGRGLAGASDYMKALKDKFNLKGLLPNKNDYAKRGLAGMTIKATDGITGPMGPSIWEKVSSRYQQKKAELLP